ncbi:MAG: thiamine pyrophosphate-binding protein [Candidatus Odinarchaeota archaeon]
MLNQELDGGDLVVKSLLNEGVTKIFGLIGGELTRIYDAIERWGREAGIDTVMVRHEQAGGHMADAWARATGEIGVCLGTVGPGVSHLIPAVAAANADSIPMLIIGAQIARMFDNIGILQGDLDQMSLMKPITKLQVSVENPYEIPQAIQRCIKTAMSGRRGPVFLELRETALVRKATKTDLEKIVEPVKYRPLCKPGGNPELINAAIEILKEAEKPIFIAGGGTVASEASKDLIKISEAYEIPCLTTILGIGSISLNHKTYAGSYPFANTFRKAASEADVVIALGCKWDFTTFFGTAPLWNQNQKIIQIDIDPKEIGKNRPVEIGIVGDVKAVLNQFLIKMEKELPKEKASEWSEWNNYLQSVRKFDNDAIKKVLESNKIPMKPERLVIETLQSIQPDTQLVVDGGDITFFTYGLISNFQRSPRSTFTSVSMGHLGVGVCYAIAVKLAKPDKTVVCISGDGSFLFNVQELETARRLNLPLIIIIANNCAWGMLKTYQKNNLNKRYCDVDLPSINYAEIAKGFGCYGEKVDDPEDFQAALKRAIESKKTAVIDVSVAFESPSGGKFFGIYKKSKGLYGN